MGQTATSASEQGSSPSDRVREAFWETTMRSLSPRLRRYVAISQCSADEIDEIVSDVFAELIAREGSFVACATQWEFVLPIVRDCCASAKQRWRHEFPASVDAFESPDPTSWEQRERYLELVARWSQATVQQLPPKQREAVQLHVLEGRSYADVAATTRSSQGAARFNVHAGLQRLYEIAKNFPPPPPPGN